MNVTKLNQWRSATIVFNQFLYLYKTRNKIFVKFNIVDFYISDTPKLLKSAVAFSKQFTDIVQLIEETIQLARKLYLLDERSQWIKTS